ncbi:hypothetical protein [Paracraurococcus lichenis]|uniref:Uncharacterized protein n=1 Tax=Paracraurococcus lichenis TaxID=3064888 RepID=A0ABT9DYK3_9PROT|nr:hypothetical protein [Paracraurococcus sp. LOR1-02]MDO9708964.1 hypothetical protein [Paracraurococcus sp. LOR1-02]
MRAVARGGDLRRGASLGLWLLLMVAWAAGLALGAVQASSLLREPAPPAELAAAGLWLAMGGLAWIAALHLGWQRYRRGPERPG